MADQLRNQLTSFINEFSYRYSNHAVGGALAQLWTASQDDGRRLLSTQNAPFAIMGSSDQLALYKYVSSKYQPACDGANAACTISRVFANLQPELSGDVSKQCSKGFDRVAEAQRCGIHSNLLLAIYDDTVPQSEPVAVFELAQHEVDVDFSQAVQILQSVAKGYGFWIPSLESARSVDAVEVQVGQPPDSAATAGTEVTSSTASSSHCTLRGSLGNIATAARAVLDHKARQVALLPLSPCAKVVMQGACALRRSACMIADRPQRTSSADDAVTAGKPHKGRYYSSRRRQPPSVIVTDYIKPKSEASPGRGRGCRKSKNRQHSRKDSNQLPQQQEQELSQSLDTTGSFYSSLSSAALAGTVQQHQQQHHGKHSRGRRSFDGMSTFRSSMGRAASGSAYSSEASGGASLQCSGAGHMRRAVTPPPTPCLSRFASRSSSGSTDAVMMQPPPAAPFQQPHTATAAETGAEQRSQRHAVHHGPGLQLQAMLGGIKGKSEHMQEMHQPQIEQWHTQDIAQHHDQFQFYPCITRDSTQQQQLQCSQQPAAVAQSAGMQQARLNPPATPAHSYSSSFDARHLPSDAQPTSLLEGRHLSPFAASAERAHSSGSIGSSGSAVQGRDRVRALVAHGGSFNHTGCSGNWEYVGGAQKLMGVSRSADIVELQRQLAGGASGQCQVKYALPGSAANNTTLVDLDTQDDVANMWDEVDEYASTHQGYKLQLYVALLSTSTAIHQASGGSMSAVALERGLSAYASSDSGRGSSGSEMSSAGSGMLHRRAASSGGLQPGTPAQSNAATLMLMQHACSTVQSAQQAQPADFASLSAAKPAGVGGASPFGGAVATAAAIQGSSGGHDVHQLQQQKAAPLFPIYSGLEVQGTDSPFTANTASGIAQSQHAVETASQAPCLNVAAEVAAQSTRVSMQLLPPPENAAVPEASASGGHSRYTSNASAVGAAYAASSSVSSMSSTRSLHARHVLSEGSAVAVHGRTAVDGVVKQKQEQLRTLVRELEGRVEIIMPSDLDIVRFLGGGAFGEVYLSKWHGSDVAVKCLSPSLIASGHASGTPCTDAVAELLKEAAVLASLHHPNIVSVFGVVLPPSELLTPATSSAMSELQGSQQTTQGGQAQVKHVTVEELTDQLLAGQLEDSSTALSTASQHGLTAGTATPASAVPLSSGIPGDFVHCRVAMASALSQGHPSAPAIVTEYLSLGSLRSAICNRADWLKGGLARVKLMLDTARGLDYLHSKRLVHFDLKSANLLVTMKDKVPCIKLADMGLTKQRRQTYVSGIDSLRGTLPWIAPEIVKNPENVSEKADIFSFGVVMWELWTMQEPFEGVHLHALLHQLASPAGLCLPIPGTPDWTDPDCPVEPAPGWCELMQRCWQAAEQRPSSKQLVACLDEIMQQLREQRRRTSEASSCVRG